MKKKVLKIVLVSLGILVATLSIVIILAVSSYRTLDKESDFYYYEYEDSDGSMVGVLDINFPSFVGGQIEKFLRSCIKEIVIPEEIDGETVRACGRLWGCGNLKSVTIPESVTSIGDYAFDCCYDLENIEIPNGVTSIGNGAFASCHSLQNIILPNTVEEIGEYAFVSCYGLKSIEIPERVTTIERGLFCDCSGLENIIMMNDVEEIVENAFEGCRRLETITFGGDVSSSNNFEPLLYVEKNVTFIVPKGSVVGNWALENGYSVEYKSANEMAEGNTESSTAMATDASVFRIEQFGGGVEILGVREEGKKLYEIVIPSEIDGLPVIGIGDSAFSECTILRSIEIPISVTTIGRLAFADCDRLESIKIPSSVTTIGQQAFFKCNILSSIEIPSSVSIIGSQAFACCSYLEDIKILSGAEISSDVFYDISKNATFIVEEGTYIANWALKNGYNVEYYASEEMFGSPKSDEYYGD